MSAISLAIALIWTTWTWDSHPRTCIPTGNCPHKSRISRRFAYSTWPWKPWQLRYQRWFPSSSPEKNMLRHAGASDTFVWPSFLDILSAIQLAVVGCWSLAVKLLVVVVKPVKISKKTWGSQRQPMKIITKVGRLEDGKCVQMTHQTGISDRIDRIG